MQAMSNDTLKRDVAGSLFTSMHRNVKIKGQPPAAQNLEGTGSVSAALACVPLLDVLPRCWARAAAALSSRTDARTLWHAHGQKKEPTV
jgi:hypothetical protein